MAQTVRNPPAMQETWVRSLDFEDPLQEDMATHSSILIWKIPWTEEPGGLQSIGSDTTEHAHRAWNIFRLILCKVLGSHSIFELSKNIMSIFRSLQSRIIGVHKYKLKYVKLSYLLPRMLFHWYRYHSHLKCAKWFLLEKISDLVIELVKALHIIKCTKVYEQIN